MMLFGDVTRVNEPLVFTVSVAPPHTVPSARRYFSAYAPGPRPVKLKAPNVAASALEVVCVRNVVPVHSFTIPPPTGLPPQVSVPLTLTRDERTNCSPGNSIAVETSSVSAVPKLSFPNHHSV